MAAINNAATWASPDDPWTANSDSETCFLGTGGFVGSAIAVLAGATGVGLAAGAGVVVAGGPSVVVGDTGFRTAGRAVSGTVICALAPGAVASRLRLAVLGCTTVVTVAWSGGGIVVADATNHEPTTKAPTEAMATIANQ